MSMWHKIPLPLRAIALGLIVSLAGTTPWAVLVTLNARHLSSVPWAVVPTAIYLWLFWRYVRGEGWPRSTADARRINCRANPLSSEVWSVALIAGILGLAAFVIFMRVYSRIVSIPSDSVGSVSHLSGITIAGWVVMSAFVAGFGEEAGFRGYMQGPIERRYGPVAAILVTGLAFGFAHFSHPQVTFTMLPYYMAAATVYGGLAYATNSIWPSIALHAGGNLLSAMTLLMQGAPLARTAPPGLVWQTGPDASFFTSCVLLLIVVAAASWAYYALARTARRQSA